MVVWTLRALFSALRDRLVFKGGTSLSKAHGIIDRFSEDVDLTVDIRSLIPELATQQSDPVPRSRSQAGQWAREVRRRLPEWVTVTAVAAIREAALAGSVHPQIEADHGIVYVAYEAAGESGSSYPRVMLEFGGRSTGEPAGTMPVTCDAANHLPDLAFPTADPRTMIPQRTFWEKATAVHAFCCHGEVSGDRISRHWYDLVQLQLAGVAESAIPDRELAATSLTNWGITGRIPSHSYPPFPFGGRVRGRPSCRPLLFSGGCW